MQHTQTVTRRYSIKKILDALPEWERLKKLTELKQAWGMEEGHYANRIINSIEGGRGPRLGDERLLAAIQVLGVSAKEIMTPFQEVTRVSVK